MAGSLQVSVIIPAHNPDPARLRRTLLALRAQTLAPEAWECVLVDNASRDPLTVARFDGIAPPQFGVVREPRLGLTAARRCGVEASSARLIVFVDDDNVLAPDYLARVAALFAANARVGALGGRSIPEFETPLEPWHHEFTSMLAVRDLGAVPQLSPESGPVREYPACSPIGAGMAVRRVALQAWLQRAPEASPSDRTGTALTSGGDNDIVLSLLGAGWRVAYFPELVLTHLIPTARLQPAYLARLNRAMQKSWMEVLSLHQLNPWPPIPRWSLHPRIWKAWLTHRGWSHPAGFVRWQGACGHFEGRIAAPVGIAEDCSR